MRDGPRGKQARNLSLFSARPIPHFLWGERPPGIRIRKVLLRYWIRYSLSRTFLIRIPGSCGFPTSKTITHAPTGVPPPSSSSYQKINLPSKKI